MSKNLTEKLILGTVQLGINYGINNPDGKPSRETSLAILEVARQNGISTLDTAEAYGDAIDVISDFHQHHKPFEITTKFIHKENVDMDIYIQQLINKLKVSYIHTLMFHRFHDMNKVDLLEWLTMQKRKQYIHHIGVSVYGNDELEASIEHPDIDVIQLPFNLLDNYTQRGALLEKAKKRNKIIHSRSVFLQGLFFKDLNTLPHSLLPMKPYLLQLRNLVAKYKMTMHEVALNYVLSCPAIDQVLFGIENVAQLHANLHAIRSSFNNELYNEINSIRVNETALLSPVNWK